MFAFGNVQGRPDKALGPAMGPPIAAASGEHPADLATGLDPVFLGMFGIVLQAILDTTRYQPTIFRVNALHIGIKRRVRRLSRVDAVQPGKSRIGDEAVLIDIPVPGAEGTRGSHRQLQAVFAVLLSLDARFGALPQFKGQSAFMGFDHGDQDAGNVAPFIAHRVVGQVHPEIDVHASVAHLETLLRQAAGLACQHVLKDRRAEVLVIRPGFVGRLAECLGMAVADKPGEAVVVDLYLLRAPEQQHRYGRMGDDIDCGTQALWPAIDCAHGIVRPVLVTHEGGDVVVGDRSVHKPALKVKL